jgi:hypothetical protein
MKKLLLIAFTAVGLLSFTFLRSPVKKTTEKPVTNVYVGKYWAPDPTDPYNFVLVKIYVDPGDQSVIIGASFAFGGPNDYSASGSHSSTCWNCHSVSNFSAVMNGYTYEYSGNLIYP